MRRLGSIFGLTIATCLLGCELGKAPAAPKVREMTETSLDSRALLRASLTFLSAHLQSLAQQLPEGEIRSAIERTIGHFVAFDVEAALSLPSEPKGQDIAESSR